jgi:DNA end-binding protein Ku
LNRKTGHRLHRQYVDAETGRPVEREDQVKGYELGEGEYIQLDPDEVAAAVPESDKTLDIEGFLACAEVDLLYFDRPYYLAPADKVAVESFALIRDAMRKAGVVAIAHTVLFRRLRTVLIRAHEDGLIATTLHFDYEVRSAATSFRGIPKQKAEGEMIDLARHIIETKRGTFDPSAFHDRYEAALADLVKAKQEGRKLPRRKAPPKTAKGDDLLEALRKSAANTSQPPKVRPRRKAG